MNKKVNYALFLIAATIVNIVIMILLFVIPTVILAVILEDKMQSVWPFLIIILPVVAIGGGYFIYSKLFKLFREKVDMNKYFEPLFKKKK
jgi:undecaprenyl pyrophosphate phosphatase UppP